MSKIHHYARLLPLLLCLSQPALAADDLMASQMADEARLWQQKDRDDLAAQVWRKLLRAAPDHPEALVNLGMIEARAGNLSQAAALQARARKLARPPAGLRQFEGAVERLAKGAAPVPVAAKAPAVTAPIAIKAPAVTAPITTKAPAVTAPIATKAPAVTAPIATKAPAVSAPIVPQAPAVTATARKTPVVPGAIPARATSTVRTRAQGGEAALAPLQSRSARVDNWADSRAKLEKLAQAHPNDPVFLLALAHHLGYNDGSRREALRQLAALASRRDRPAGLQDAWRDVLMQLAPRADDAPLYAPYQASYPADTAMTARAASLRAGVVPAARPVVAVAVRPSPARADVLLAEALADERAGAFQAASAKLERAMLQAPSNGAIRVALARQYEQLERGADAENLLDALLAVEPDLTMALYARARMYGQQQRWAEGLELLERIAPAQRDAGAMAQQRSLWIGAQLERARQSVRAGGVQEPAAIVAAAEQAAVGQQAALVQVAAAWSDIGQPARGLRVLRDVLGSGVAVDTASRIGYAQILLDSFEDAELAVVLRDLAAPARLTPGQRAALDRIALVHALRQAEQLREEGRLAEAAARLAPLLERSADARLLVAMARIRRAGGEPAAALVLAEQAVAREGNALGHRLLACELALALDNPAKAQAHASAALALAPSHPRVLAIAGRVAFMRGNQAEAQSYFQRARAAERDPTALAGAAGNLGVRLVDDAVLGSGARATP